MIGPALCILLCLLCAAVGFVAGILFTCWATDATERRNIVSEAKRRAERQKP